MTIQERIDHELISKKYTDGTWKEGTMDELINDYPFVAPYLSNSYIMSCHVAILKSTKEDKHYHLYLFTEKNEYYIVINKNYMGCQYSTRYQRPLENWTRGNDLPDGKCNEHTLNFILLAILGTELIKYDDGTKIPCCGVCGEKTEVIEPNKLDNSQPNDNVK